MHTNASLQRSCGLVVKRNNAVRKNEYQMSNKRNEHIGRLLSELDLLKEQLLSVRESDTLPFSFFSDSFNRVETVSRSLHDLELLQIGEMKEQMERLVRFVSEARKSQQAAPKPDLVPVETPEVEAPAVEEPHEEDVPAVEEAPVEPQIIVVEQEKVTVRERIVLPEYKDPRTRENVAAPVVTANVPPAANVLEKRAARCLNDVIQAPPTVVDLKRGLSLNERFLFQRELFHNNRFEMDSVMETMNKLGGFEQVESYLRDARDWDFENPTVKEFLLVVKKGFE